jgi:hypothetical protein
VTDKENVPVIVNGKPHEARLETWIDSVGTVMLPLLAGFSITSLVVVSDDAGSFQFPGATILALSCAALVLILAVQCAYHARVYLLNKRPDYERGIYWARWTRRFYDAGLFSLLVGVALIVFPHHTTDVQAGFRLAAFILACLTCLGEIAWVFRDKWLRPK